jgi:hypothetical protein
MHARGHVERPRGARSAVGPQQNFRHFQVISMAHAVTCGFPAQPAQLRDVNAEHVIRAVLRRVGGLKR